MNTEMMKQFDVLDVETLEMVEGGKNNMLTNVVQGGMAARAGWGLGATICTVAGLGMAAPACGYFGAVYGVAGWAMITSATGGF